MLSDKLRLQSLLETAGLFQYYAYLLKMIQQNKESQKSLFEKNPFNLNLNFHLRTLWTDMIFFLLKISIRFFFMDLAVSS